MPRDPFPTVLEYLRAPEPQVRKNAVTALAILGGRESVVKLVETAMDEGDAGVRARAETELLELGDPERGYAEAAIGAFLRDPAHANVAYALAGRLRSRGWAGRPPLGMSYQRLVQANEVGALVYPDRGWQFVTRALFPGFLAAVLGTALLGVLLAFSGIMDGSLLSIAVWGVALSVVLALVTTQRAVPIELQYDVPVAVAVELAWAAVLALLPSVGAMLLLQFAGPEGDSGQLVALATPLFVVAVRAGTLAGAGAVTGQRASRWAARFAGTGAGLIAAMFIYRLFQGQGGGDLVEQWWLMLITASFGVASAFADVDSSTAPRRRPPSRLAQWLTAVLVLAVIVPVVLVLLPVRKGDTKGPGLRQVVLPGRWTLDPGTPYGFSVVVVGDGRVPSPRYALALTSTPRDLPTIAHTPPVLVQKVTQDDAMYDVTVESFDGGIAGQILNRLAAHLPVRAQRDTAYLELRPLPHRAVWRAALDLLQPDSAGDSTAVPATLASLAGLRLRRGELLAAVDALRAAPTASLSLPPAEGDKCLFGAMTDKYAGPEVRSTCGRAVASGAKNFLDRWGFPASTPHRGALEAYLERYRGVGGRQPPDVMRSLIAGHRTFEDYLQDLRDEEQAQGLRSAVMVRLPADSAAAPTQ